jgi:acyl-CoA thioester hydrolase
VSIHVYDCHVRFSDVDVYGHVNNVKYFEYFQEARIAFLTSLGSDLQAAESTERQVVARIDVGYRRPILFRATPYVVETEVTRIGTSSYDLACRILDEPGDTGPSYSDATVRLVAFDLATHRSRPLSDTERRALEGVLAR